jgi:hypothetical protein
MLEGWFVCWATLWEDELSALFDRQMSMTQLHPTPRETTVPSQVPEIASFFLLCIGVFKERKLLRSKGTWIKTVMSQEINAGLLEKPPYHLKCQKLHTALPNTTITRPTELPSKQTNHFRVAFGCRHAALYI